MTANNDVYENEEMKPTGLPSDEVVAMTQEELINGLLAAADYAVDEDSMKLIVVERGGRKFFEFKIHALSETELMRIRKQCLNYKRNPAGKNLPKIEELDIAKFRSMKIYEATADDDKLKLWDNPQIKAGLNAKGKNIIMSYEIIDAVLLAGEKVWVSDVIDKLSGYKEDGEEEVELEEYAKN